ncbi:MAG: lasso peptide biosynthesis B2 protein [Chromatiales bacterium]|nr:lasso peptide biosynthesis B2 protein [Chromatiales bacterium]
MCSRLLLLECFWRLSLAAVQVRLLPYRWWRHRLRQQPRTASVSPAATHLLPTFHRAARHIPWSDNCLIRSLALRDFLRCHGQPAQLCLGTRHDGDGWQFHAWVQCEHVLFDSDHSAEFHRHPLTS